MCPHTGRMSMASSAQEKTVNFREFRKNLSCYLREAERGGAVVVTSRGKSIARLGPPPTAMRPRAELLGMFKEIQMADDFDDTPADMIEAMEQDI